MDWPNNPEDTTDTTVAYRTMFDGSESESPSITIATALATLEDTSPYRSEFNLTDSVDPDALDDLLVDETRGVRVTFTMLEYLVVAKGDGIVEIWRRDE